MAASYNFLIEPNDGDTRMHIAAYEGNLAELWECLADAILRHNINRPVKPYLATPLRIASTNGNANCVSCLIKHGAVVDSVDFKGQTPLFVAVQKKFLNCMKILLEARAHPDGSPKNLSSPLYIAAQNGFTDGVKLLLKFGAKTEPQNNNVYGLPIHTAICYQHYECYVTLLKAGAEADLRRVQPLLPSGILAKLSLAHAMVHHKCAVKFAESLVEFGGYLWQRNDKGILATELPVDGPCKKYLQSMLGQPLKLQSLCRIIIRRIIGHQRLDSITHLALPLKLIKFLQYRGVSASRL